MLSSPVSHFGLIVHCFLSTSLHLEELLTTVRHIIDLNALQASIKSLDEDYTYLKIEDLLDWFSKRDFVKVPYHVLLM
jgi:hypothetical protein